VRQARIGEDLREPRAKLPDVPGLHEEARDAVVDHLRQPAEPACDDGRPARHRLDRGETEQLRHRDFAPVARPVHRRQGNHLRPSVERRQVGVGDGAEELDGSSRGEPPKQARILPFGQAGVVPGGADDTQVGVLRQRLDQAIEALVGRHSPDEEDAAAGLVGIGREAIRVGASVDHACSRRRRSELARRIGRYGEKTVEEPREQPCPVPARESVVRHGGRYATDARVDGRKPARRASQVVCVDDVRFGERLTETERERMRGVPAEQRERAKNADPEAARVTPGAHRPSEADELALHVAGERTAEFEREALAAPEDPSGAEERRSDVDDPHLVLPLITVGDPRRLSGGYLYHLRMADAAPAHGARIVFRSLPERLFPLATLRGAAALRRSTERPASAVLIDSIAAAFTAPALAMRRLDVPVVGVLHQPPGGIDHGAVRTRAQAPLDRLAWRRAELLIAASDHLAERLLEAGFQQSRIRVVPPGRDVAAASARPSPDLRAGRRAALLTIANWLPRKGIVELLEAFAALPADVATLHLAGDDAADPRYAARVRRRLSEPELRGRVVVHGRLAREDVAALYRAADVFVLPAFREPYGTVWGEAMALGLPVVGWRAGNLPYLAEDEEEGLLVEPGDVDGLRRALLRLATDDAARASLGAAAKRRAEARPTWQDSAALFFAAIRDMLARR
jgi:glycosyltransferase involved in cell wall biosynthesis